MMNMSIFEKDFARMFPESERAEIQHHHALRLVEKIDDTDRCRSILAGDYSWLARKTLIAAESRSQMFWDSYRALCEAYHKPEKNQIEIESLLNVLMKASEYQVERLLEQLGG